jgi:hypothetical protein
MSRGVGTGGMMVGNTRGHSYSDTVSKQAFLLVNSKNGYEEEVVSFLKESGHKASRVFGIYDIVAEVKAETPGELKESVAKIRKNSYVRSLLKLNVGRGFLPNGEVADLTYRPKE